MSQTSDPTNGRPTSWRSTDAGAELISGPLSAGLVSGHLGAGLVGLSHGDDLLAKRVFRATTPDGHLPHAAESYVRGADHVSTHAPDNAFPFRTQLSWTGAPLGPGSAVVLTVSLQTDLLDTRPQLAFHTVAAAESAEAAFGGFRAATIGGQTLLLVPHPADASETKPLRTEAGLGLQLSPPFLEKGVIRRLRLAAIALPAGATEADVQHALAGFATLPLPLTT